MTQLEKVKAIFDLLLTEYAEADLTFIYTSNTDSHQEVINEYKERFKSTLGFKVHKYLSFVDASSSYMSNGHIFCIMDNTLLVFEVKKK
jgi:hypothetical protein